ERGIIETRKNLDKLGFNYVGCRDGKVGECSSTVVALADKKIGIAGFSMVYSKLNTAKAEKVINDLASTTDLVIVNMHWGTEYKHQFNKLQQETAHTLIDAGADIIIGHHPHVVQDIEVYQGKPIFYSLGNFVFDQYFSQDTQEGLAIGVSINDEKTDFFLYPLKSKLSQVELMVGEEKKNFLQELIEWSEVDEEMSEQIQSGKLIFK
ncbi:CapA family protein, partial [Candidatus Parcubacteria bacterium]|nr:CapA family protein [Candidatus Parcubacteria bacterium]